MMLGEARFREAAEELLGIVQEELAGFQMPAEVADVGRALGLEHADLDREIANADAAWLDARTRHWNQHADAAGLPRIVWYDHGDEVELLVGAAGPV